MSSIFKDPKVFEQQLKVDEERWYAIGHGRLTGITTVWHICFILTRRYPGASFKKFKSRADAEDWLLRIHHLKDRPLITLEMATNAVDAAEAAAAAASLPALAPLPAAVPSSSPPSSTPPSSMGQLFQLLQQNFGDARTMEALRHLLSVPTASNESLAGGAGALPGPSSSPGDPVFSPRAPHAGRKSLAIDWTSDEDANPSSRRPRSNANPPSSSAASSSTNSTTTEPRIRTVRLAQSSDQARSAKRARHASGDLTFVSATADINDRFVNIQPALDRLNEIFMRGNAVIITEDRIAAPEDDEERSDALMGLEVSGAYNKVTADHAERWEEMNKSTSKGKGKARAQGTVKDERDGSEGDTSQGFHHPPWDSGIRRGRVLRCDDAEGVDCGNNSNDGGAGDKDNEGDKGNKGDHGHDSDWESV